MQPLLRAVVQKCLWRKLINTRAYCITTSATNQQDNIRKKISFDEFVQHRQLEATRSLVVQVSSEKSFTELYNYCSTFGNIISAHHYSMNYDDVHHYILLEFSNAQEAAAAIDSSAYNEDLSGVPVRSPFLWFRALKNKRPLTQQTENKPVGSLKITNGTHILDNTAINDILAGAGSLEEQINLLHKHTKLNDLGVRLRFLAALQVQQALTGMFPAANAQPFGSTVNGFGKMGCDLDLILRFDQEASVEVEKQRKESRLVFHIKENLSNGRSQTQRQMESIGDMLQLFLPGVCHVRRILQARVPIIKYHHEHMNLEVDLSMSNLSGFYMSELFYMFGEIDERVRPLTFCVRRWAQACGLTNPSPGRWITNFSLTCLVMFFLQQLKKPILPTINALTKCATASDVRMTEDGINCSFGRNLQNIGFVTKNTSELNELLLQFFEFYAQFDYNSRAISLNEGRAIAKPDHSALYIINPLENHLNVSKNVSLEECERLRSEVRNTAWILESEVEHPVTESVERSKTHWGLLNIFRTPEKTILRPNMFFKPRMMEVVDLFETETEKKTDVNFKSETVKQQVQQIKAQAKIDVKRMQINSTNEETKARRRR